MTRWTAYDSEFVGRRFDRLAKLYVLLEWVLLLPPGIRRRAVAALRLGEGDRVLEVGCGTGRNFELLQDAVGRRGHIFGVDVSTGMLARCRDLCARRRWDNVTLFQGDVLDQELPAAVDGVLFSLSYSILARREEALLRTWARVRAGRRVVILDHTTPPGRTGKLLRPLMLLVNRATVLGNPDLKPWEELRRLTADVEVRQELFGIYFVCAAAKPSEGTSGTG